MGEYEPEDSRDVTLSNKRVPGEPPRTGPREDEARRRAGGKGARKAAGEGADEGQGEGRGEGVLEGTRMDEPQQKARQAQAQSQGRWQSQSRSQSQPDTQAKAQDGLRQSPLPTDHGWHRAPSGDPPLMARSAVPADAASRAEPFAISSEHRRAAPGEARPSSGLDETLALNRPQNMPRARAEHERRVREQAALQEDSIPGFDYGADDDARDDAPTVSDPEPGVGSEEAISGDADAFGAGRYRNGEGGKGEAEEYARR